MKTDNDNELNTRFLFYLLLQSGLVRYYLRNAMLQEDLLQRTAPVTSHTPTFEVINIERMPPAYQLEYRVERSELSGQQQQQEEEVNESTGAAASVARANNESRGARVLPAVGESLVVGAIGTAAAELAATLLFSRK